MIDDYFKTVTIITCNANSSKQFTVHFKDEILSLWGKFSKCRISDVRNNR